MIIQCSSCARKFIVKDEDIPKNGRTVQCGYCSITWHQMPTSTKVKNIKKEKPIKPSPAADESPSVENLRASDGKTYKFLGSQWAELLPSGKTGLFARKKIAKELDEITGRKKVTTIRKKRKKIEDVDPSLESMDNQKRLPDIYKPNQGLGFFGYIFLLIIIGFSIVGILRTFEDDLITNFPEIEYFYNLLDEQLIYLAESVKNIIVIINDLINSY
tara:strand:- start:29 stop:676 length:648 start_codon:yes stop_codon:yes gene_type:complete